MRFWLKRIVSLKIPETGIPFLFMGVAVLAYGLLIPKLGFYWDDLPISWIRYELGPEALTDYFSTNRPIWGLLYQFTSRILPQVPIYWQVFALFWRWLSGVLVWATLRKLFPKQPRIALTAGLLFLLYPGFNQQWGSYLYSHFFIVLCFFLLSFYLMLHAQKEHYWLWTSLAMLLSALNLWMHEYFFTIEIARIGIIWILLREYQLDIQPRIRKAIKLWAPYLAVFVAAVLSRLFIFSNQIYEIGVEGTASPLFELVGTVFQSLWVTSFSAWAQAFLLPDFSLQGQRTILIYIAVILTVFILTLVFVFQSKEIDDKQTRQDDALWIISLGVMSLLLAGTPFWMTGLPVSLGFPANRATLSFMFGSALLVTGLLALVPRQKVSAIFLAVLVAFSAGRQFLWADEFRRDWTVQKNLFWQMSWRIPDLEDNTLVLLNEGALKFYADNSLSVPLNWIYAPDIQLPHIPYTLFYPKNRLGEGLPSLEAGVPVTHDYLAGKFNGNTSQVLVINFSPPGCLHILDPEVDAQNRLIADEYIRDAMPLTNPNLILTFGLPRLPDIYGPEPSHGWCYYFQKADLARQQGDWERVVLLGEQAFELNDHPNDPTERFVFIEAYAHVNDWGSAEQLSLSANQVSPSYLSPMLCRLWERIERTTSASSDKEPSVAKMTKEFSCE